MYFGPNPEHRFVILWSIDPTLSSLIAEYGGLIDPTVPLDRRLWLLD
jgi:hypothetical protein